MKNGKQRKGEFQAIIRQVLIPMFFKETQLDRSLRGRSKQFKKRFKKKLFNTILKLYKEADRLTLKNKHIRKKIKEVCLETGSSVGQAQKLINVCLKYYCILTNKPLLIIKELDCPLDSQIMFKFKTKNVKQSSLKDMKNFDDYVAWQNHLEEIGKGIRLRPDIEAYDKERIKLFLS